jgi:hypothetical protein
MNLSRIIAHRRFLQQYRLILRDVDRDDLPVAERWKDN